MGDDEGARSPRVRLTGERVVGAAVALADESGIAALTMRRVAQALGVEAMALYHYVPSKEALLEAMVDLVVGEMALPAPGEGWRRALRSSAVSAHDALRRHPWAAPVMASSGVGPARLRHMDAVLGTLRGAGFSVALTHHAYHALDSHVVGFSLWAAGYPPESELSTLATTFLAQLPADAYPHLAEHVQHHLTGADDEGSEFEFGLDLLLDGLERLRSTPAGQRNRPPSRGVEAATNRGGPR